MPTQKWEYAFPELEQVTAGTIDGAGRPGNKVAAPVFTGGCAVQTHVEISDPRVAVLGRLWFSVGRRICLGNGLCRRCNRHRNTKHEEEAGQEAKSARGLHWGSRGKFCWRPPTGSSQTVGSSDALIKPALSVIALTGFLQLMGHPHSAHTIHLTGRRTGARRMDGARSMACPPLTSPSSPQECGRSLPGRSTRSGSCLCRCDR
jgi:hypothetical protein